MARQEQRVCAGVQSNLTELHLHKPSTVTVSPGKAGGETAERLAAGERNSDGEREGVREAELVEEGRERRVER